MKCKEYRVMTHDPSLSERIQADIDTWESENLGTLEVNGVHPFRKAFSMEPDTSDTWVLVTFSFNGPSDAEIAAMWRAI